MSHTSGDSQKSYLTNSTITYVDNKEKKIENPVGGINNRGKDIRSNCMEIPLIPEYRLIDNNKVVYKSGNLKDVQEKQNMLQTRGTNEKEPIYESSNDNPIKETKRKRKDDLDLLK